MKNSSTTLIVIFVLKLPRLVLCSRCDVSIHALNKMIGVNSSSTRTDSFLLVVLGVMNSVHLYPVFIDHLSLLLYKRLSSGHLTTFESTYNINWNAGDKCVDYFSSLFALPLQNDQCKLLPPLVCITGSQDMLRDCISFACLKLTYGLFDALCLCCRHRDCTFLGSSVPITPIEKNSLSTVNIPIRMPFFMHSSTSFETVSGENLLF